MKALLAIMHPRRLSYFIKAVNKIDYIDVLLAKNFKMVDAQLHIQKYFLDNDYDVMIFTSDDVIIPYDAPLKILKDMREYKYEIITGWSRCRPTKPEANITLEPPRLIERNIGRPVFYNQYNFIKVNEIQSLIKSGKYVIPVWFVGWSLTGMTKAVVEKWEPRGWYFQHTEPYHYVYQGRKGCWASTDLWYSYDLWKKGLVKYCDLRVYIIHEPPLLGRANVERAKLLLVGKEPQELELRTAKKPIIL